MKRSALRKSTAIFSLLDSMGCPTLRIVFGRIADRYYMAAAYLKAIYEPTSNVLTSQSTWTEEDEGSGDDEAFMADFSRILDKFLAR